MNRIGGTLNSGKIVEKNVLAPSQPNSSESYEDDFDEFEADKSIKSYSIPNLDNDYRTNNGIQQPSPFDTTSSKRTETSNLETISNLQRNSMQRSTNFKNSIGCGTSDFLVNLENQTDEIENFSSWTQAPPSMNMVESGHDKEVPFSHILRQKSIVKLQQNDPTALNAFLQKAGSLILEMLAENDFDTKTQSIHKTPNGRPTEFSKEEPFLIGQEPFGKNFVFDQCQIESVSVSDTNAPFFLICHSFSTNSTEKGKNRLRGFVSGWNSLAVSDPDFVLATFDKPTRAVALLAGGEAIVAGHQDGSLACWDRREMCVFYDSLMTGIETENEKRNGAELQIRLPCFHSCASKEDNHNRAIVDVVAYPLQENNENIGNTACASLDENGVILTWHVITRSVEEAWKEVDIAGAKPGARIVLVQIRRLTTWTSSISPQLTAFRIVIDPTDGMVFFVNCSDLRIRRVHRDGAVLQPNTYGTNDSTDVPPSFSRFDSNYFLTASFDGRIMLNNKKFSNPIFTWILPNSGKILSVCWSEENPYVFISVDENGLIRMWKLQKILEGALMKTTKVTSDSDGHGHGHGGAGGDGGAVAKWKGAVKAPSPALLFWIPKLQPLVVFLNPRSQEPANFKVTEQPFVEFEDFS